MRKYGESKTTRIMMATVPHVISGLGLRKFQAGGFLLTRVYLKNAVSKHRPRSVEVFLYSTASRAFLTHSATDNRMLIKERYSGRKLKTQLVYNLVYKLIVFLTSLHCTFMLHTHKTGMPQLKLIKEG